LWLSLFALLMGVALATIIGRGITRPILGMTDAMRQLADGDKTVEIPSRENKDEIGTMAKAVEGVQGKHDRQRTPSERAGRAESPNRGRAQGRLAGNGGVRSKPRSAV
jgi:methyl-accepting chemotaxis protein